SLRAWSSERACARACSGSKKAQACTSGSTAWMRSMHASTSISALKLPSRSAWAAATASSQFHCGALIAGSAAVDCIGEPQHGLRPDIDEDHGEDHDEQERHAA